MATDPTSSNCQKTYRGTNAAKVDIVGNEGDLYFATDTNQQFRWTDGAWVEVFSQS